MYRVVKRLFDLAFGCVLLVLLFPLLFVVCLINAFYLKKSPFFFQERVGENNITFTIFKLRTVNTSLEDVSNSLWLQFLRESSIDELPQLVNIIKGEMSFVGPRPLLVDYLELYTQRQRKRHLVKPGLTGLVQVSGGNDLDWNERFELDLEYIERQGFIFDLGLLIRTVTQTIRNDKSNSHYSDTFKGNK